MIATNILKISLLIGWIALSACGAESEQNSSRERNDTRAEDAYENAIGSMIAFFTSLNKQNDISNYTTESVFARFDCELLALRKVQKDGQELVALENLVKERLDCVVFFAEHSQQSPRNAAVAVACYLKNIKTFLHTVDRGAVADECVRLLEDRKNALIAVPLFYYAKYIGGKAISEPTNINADKGLRDACDVYFRNKR